MQTVTTLKTDSDHEATLAADIAEGLATGSPDYRVRTPAHDQHYTPLMDVVSLAIGMPGDPILTALLALLADGLRSTDAVIVLRARAAVEAISAAHVESQLESAVQEDADAAPLFVPSPWSREARRGA